MTVNHARLRAHNERKAIRKAEAQRTEPVSPEELDAAFAAHDAAQREAKAARLREQEERLARMAQAAE